jgi:trans-aconitate methyltransferase
MFEPDPEVVPSQSQPILTEPRRYQDYVIKDGRFVGRFEEMYKDFDDPWHQSETRISRESYSRWATILHIRRFGIGSLVECGAGLGSFTQLLTEETGARVTGIDISETAVGKARARYPNLRFEVDTVNNLSRYRDHEAVLFAEITWYLLDQFDSVLDTLRDNFSGKYFLHNLVFYKSGQRYGREYFTTLDEFIARVPFELVARMEGTTKTMDTIETSTVFRIP